MSYIYVNEDLIDPLLKCQLCSKPYVDPVITQNDGRFCRSCITQRVTIFNSSEETNYRPSLLSNLVSIDEQLLHEMLDNLLVICPDCQLINIPRKDLQTHLLTQCPKRIVLCRASDLKCPWSGCYEQSAEHSSTCTFELLRPILSERTQHRDDSGEYQKLIEEQRAEIAQLRKQVDEYKDRTEKFQKGYRTFWEINVQQRQKCDKFQDDMRQDITEENLRRNQLRDDVQNLREQFNEMKALLEQPKEASSKSNEMEDVLQQLKQLKMNQESDNQIKQFQQQESTSKGELLRLRQMCRQHEIQIGLLARKRCVMPTKSTTTTAINSRLEGLIEAYNLYSDIDFDGKHFDNQDMELVCRGAIIDKQCRKLRLENNDITTKGAAILADTLYGNTFLEELHLSNNSISDMGAHALAQVLSINNQTLTWLEIHANHITDDGAEYLAEMLKTNTTLILLGLSFNQIGDRGVQCLTNSIAHYNKTLHCLYLASNKAITDASVGYIKDMFRRNQPMHLKALFLNDCDFSPAGTKALKKIGEENQNFLLEV